MKTFDTSLTALVPIQKLTCSYFSNNNIGAAGAGVVENALPGVKVKE